MLIDLVKRSRTFRRFDESVSVSMATLRELVAMHAELPDVWDFAHGTWEACSGTSRFTEEAAQEELIRVTRD